jgi:hypothetical protein
LSERWGISKSNEHFNFELIGRFFDLARKDNIDCHQVISDRTATDLDLNEVFKVIDRTSSKVGQQYLYFKLRTLRSETDELKKFDLLVELFLNDASLRLQCQLELHNLNSSGSYYLQELLRKEQIQRPKWLKVAYALSLATIGCLILAPVYPVTLLVLLPLFIANAFIHYFNKGNINYYLIAVSEFFKSIAVSENISKQPAIKAHFGDTLFLNAISKLKSKARFISFEKQMNGDIASIAWALFELIKIMFNVEVLVFFRFIGGIEKAKKHIEQLFCFLGEIDSAISTASVRYGAAFYSKPDFVENKKLYIEHALHPLIQNCTPNDLNMIDQSMLLTGSNMSGKTTFIRAIGINAILAQTIYTCFAKKYTAPVFKVFTSIGISDDLLQAKSYYLQEVLTIKEFIEQSEKLENCLFILDEIFKGTNTLERVSSAKAILSYLNKPTHMVLASTHDLELTMLLSKDDYCLYHFAEHIESNQLMFDYKLKPGILKTRNAIKILELYNYPAEIILNARNTLEGIR